MKSSLAAMVVAVEGFVAAQPAQAGAVALLITSDEEGPALDGTVKVCDWLAARGEQPRLLHRRRADSVEHARRHDRTGGAARSRASCASGVQGHVAYPQLRRNPIHPRAGARRTGRDVWDHGNAYFPATSWQVSNIHAGTGAGNVIPGELVVDFNFRF